MRLKLGSSSLTFKSEKIRLNTKLSVKIVRKQVYERTEFSFACCGFFGGMILHLLVLEWLNGEVFLYRLSLYAVAWIRTVYYIFLSVRSAGGTFVD